MNDEQVDLLFISAHADDTELSCGGTIVKMAITLLVTMVICFAFRSSLVTLMQRPLRVLEGQHIELRALGITDSITICVPLNDSLPYTTM